MSFLTTAFFAGFAALAVPVVIHLLFRQRSRRIDLGTLRFLKVVVTRNTRRRRLKRYVLLALRLAAVALLVALFARPFLLAGTVGGTRSLLVVLIDRSASMALGGGESQPAAVAVAQAQEIINAAGGRTVEVAYFDAAVTPLAAETPPTVSAAMFGPTDYGAALAWAGDRRAAAGATECEVVLLTDLQRSGLTRVGDAEPPVDLPVRVVDVGQPVGNNLAVASARPRRSVVRPRETVTLDVIVYNSGSFKADNAPIVVRLASGGTRRTLREKLTVPAGETAALEFELPELPTGLWRGSVTIEARDDLAFDDVRQFAVLVGEKDRVLLMGGGQVGGGQVGGGQVSGGQVSGGQGEASPFGSPTFFLESSLRLAPPGAAWPDAPYEPVRPTTPGLPADLSPYRVVVLTDPGPLSAADAARLKAFVSGGGGLLVFTGEQVTPTSTRSLAAAGLTPGEIGPIVRAAGRPVRLTEWDSTHAVFAPFADPQAGDLRGLAFDAYTKITPAKTAQVLAKFGDDPAVLETKLGRGRVLWFATAADREWGTWTRSGLFLPLVYQLLGRLTGLTEGGAVREATLDAQHTADLHTADLPAEPGVYPQGNHTLVVNVDPRESDLDRCTPTELLDRFGLLPIDAPAAVRDADSQALRRDELWPWCVLCVLGVLLAETFLGNRTEA